VLLFILISILVLNRKGLVFRFVPLLLFLLKQLDIDLPFDPVIPLLGIYPKDCDTGYSRGTCTPMFFVALFTIAKLWKQPRCPSTDEWIKKM
jgi:hypothetical protein